MLMCRPRLMGEPFVATLNAKERQLQGTRAFCARQMLKGHGSNCSYRSRRTRTKLTMIATRHSAVPMISAIVTISLSACIDRCV